MTYEGYATSSEESSVKNKIAIVLPVHNELDSLPSLLSRIEGNVEDPILFIFVDDGSTDESLAWLTDFQPKQSNSKRIIVLSRNFGHQAALMSGLCHVPGNIDRIVVMDSDLQDRPEDIPSLLEKLDEGFDCAYAVRSAATGSLFINWLTLVFYRLQKSLLSIQIPLNAGTFSAFNREMLDKLKKFGEREVYFPGLRAFVGLKQVGVDVSRDSRVHGHSKVGFWGLVNLSLVGILGFSALPMRFIFLFGLFLTMVAFFMGIGLFLLRIWGVTKILGVTTILIFILGCFGVQIVFLGMVGEYIGKLFLEVKERPRWIVHRIVDNPETRRE